jgi:hypothetical protein
MCKNVTKRRCDIIFLSDLRLNSSLQKSGVHDVEKQFQLQGYKLFHNSVSSVRGVGILVHKNIRDGNFIIHGD